MRRLLVLAEAAAEVGVPKGSLRTAAEQHGYLVRIGRALRIDPETLPELIKLCREQPQEHASTADVIPKSTSSATQDAGSTQRARETAEKLKQLSRGTSPKETAHRAARVHPIR